MSYYTNLFSKQTFEDYVNFKSKELTPLEKIYKNIESNLAKSLKATNLTLINSLKGKSKVEINKIISKSTYKGLLLNYLFRLWNNSFKLGQLEAVADINNLTKSNFTKSNTIIEFADNKKRIEQLKAQREQKADTFRLISRMESISQDEKNRRKEKLRAEVREIDKEIQRLESGQEASEPVTKIKKDKTPGIKDKPKRDRIARPGGMTEEQNKQFLEERRYVSKQERSLDNRITSTPKSEVKTYEARERRRNLQATSLSGKPIMDTAYGQIYLRDRNLVIANKFDVVYKNRIKQAISSYVDSKAPGKETLLFKELTDDKRTQESIARIAKTEIVAAYNLGRYQAYLEHGIENVKWNTSLERNINKDDNPCTFCDARDGKVFPLSLFSNPPRQQPVLTRKTKTVNNANALNWLFVPVHPNCMCVLLPTKDKPSEEILSAIEKSQYIKYAAWASGATIAALSLAVLYNALSKYTTPVRITANTLEEVQSTVRNVLESAIDTFKGKEEIVAELLQIPINLAIPDIETVLNVQDNKQQQEIIQLQEQILNQAESNNKLRSPYKPSENVTQYANSAVSGEMSTVEKSKIIQEKLKTRQALNDEVSELISLLSRDDLSPSERKQLIGRSKNKLREIDKNIKDLETIRGDITMSKRNLAYTNDDLIRLMRGELIAKLDNLPSNISTQELLLSLDPIRDVHNGFRTLKEQEQLYDNLDDLLEPYKLNKDAILSNNKVRDSYLLDNKKELAAWEDKLRGTKVNRSAKLSKIVNRDLDVIRQVLAKGESITEARYDELKVILWRAGDYVTTLRKELNESTLDVGFLETNLRNKNPLLQSDIKVSLNEYKRYVEDVNEVFEYTSDMNVIKALGNLVR